MSDVYRDPDQPDQPAPGERSSAWNKEEQETKPFKVTGPISIKGQDYAEGSTVNLTEEEYNALSELHAPLEGVEPVSEEEIQSKHEEAVEAQKAAIEERAAKDEEARARLKEKEEAKEEQDPADAEADKRVAGSTRELTSGRGGVAGADVAQAQAVPRTRRKEF